ncbi:hypothetical protein HH303_18875 [Rhodospirillaceae bacterium KN72]|uniref:Uncharacterized protein n=1 Tax=Pacificispira spongiicola TaxID=2729598 RepID=A0A7Y0E3G4_9PROT|nr:hypothetical protein [Pacificispira spongiicola]NMM46562.1 hypothetical protein [Pacificispira spongiicola]
MDIRRATEIPSDDTDHATVVKYIAPSDQRVTHYLTGSVARDGKVVFLQPEFGRYDIEADAIQAATEFAEAYGLNEVVLVDQT